jgi:hypothetical protein
MHDRVRAHEDVVADRRGARLCGVPEAPDDHATVSGAECAHAGAAGADVDEDSYAVHEPV